MDQAYPYDDDQKQREEHAHELATYLRAHPSPNHSLRERVKVLSRVSEDELDRLLPEVEYWSELFDWQDESNS
jgi:hypothetical protein